MLHCAFNIPQTELALKGLLLVCLGRFGDAHLGSWVEPGLRAPFFSKKTQGEQSKLLDVIFFHITHN